MDCNNAPYDLPEQIVMSLNVFLYSKYNDRLTLFVPLPIITRLKSSRQRPHTCGYPVDIDAPRLLNSNHIQLIEPALPRWYVLDFFSVSLSADSAGDGSLLRCASSASSSISSRERLRLSATLIVQQGKT